MGIAQKNEGKIKNLVLETAEPRSARGFHKMVIDGQFLLSLLFNSRFKF